MNTMTRAYPLSRQFDDEYDPLDEIFDEYDLWDELEGEDPYLELEATPRKISYTEVNDNRFSVPAQESLMRMSKDPAKSVDANGLLQAVKSGQLAGIWCVNWKAPCDRAQRYGKSWGEVIPKGEDAVLMLDPDNPLKGIPLIAFRRTLDLRPQKGCGKLSSDTSLNYFPARLDAALLKALAEYKLWRQKKSSFKQPPECKVIKSSKLTIFTPRNNIAYSKSFRQQQQIPVNSCRIWKRIYFTL